jgi:3',5'-cyclic AMP phosphodiesterase CpdA
VRTAVISDLHLGSGADDDLLRRRGFRERLWSALEGVDSLVLLGDVVELRDRPLLEAIELATPFFEELGEVLDGAQVILVPGNHDHHLVEAWLEARRLDDAAPLGLEQRGLPEEGPVLTLDHRLGRSDLELAYPGIWIRPGVYATHGHYLDRHLTIPTFERLGVAAVERILGMEPVGPGPPQPFGPAREVTAEEYERAQAPVYAFLFALAQAGTRVDAGSPSARVWAALSSGETRAARVRGWLLGAVALPGAVGVANRLGLGPVRPDLSATTISEAGIAAAGEFVERLGIEAEHVILGHTHRRGPMPDEEEWTAGGETRLLNTGSWVHSPTLLGSTAADSPYWPGTVALVDDGQPPSLLHVLDGMSREELAERG